MAVPLRPPMSHMMMEWSELPENSTLWTGSQQSDVTLPGAHRCGRKNTAAQRGGFINTLQLSGLLRGPDLPQLLVTSTGKKKNFRDCHESFLKNHPELILKLKRLTIWISNPLRTAFSVFFNSPNRESNPKTAKITFQKFLRSNYTRVGWFEVAWDGFFEHLFLSIFSEKTGQRFHLLQIFSRKAKMGPGL